MRRLAMAAAALVVGATTLTGCSTGCSGLTASEQAKAVAADGYEVSRETNSGTECELQPDGTWQRD